MKTAASKLAKLTLEALVSVFVITLFAGCSLTPQSSNTNADMNNKNISNKTTHSANTTEMRAIVSPQPPIASSPKSNLPEQCKTSTVSWGDLLLQAPSDTALILSAKSSNEDQQNSTSISQDLSKAIHKVPAQVWTYGFAALAVGAILTVLLSGYRLIGMSLCAAAILAMCAVSLIYTHGEMISYALAGIIVICAFGAVIALLVILRQKNKTSAAFREVVQGCEKFLRSNTDNQAIELFRKSQLSKQQAATRKAVRKITHNE